ncbi:MAG: 15-cis-phytoene synthase CrtB [Cyanobacteria bacterium P01_F01_bin.150]
MLQLSKPAPTTSRSISSMNSLEDAYEFCRQVTAKYSKTFYLGTMLMPKRKRRAIWAIYVWCRRTDELVDGPEAVNTTSATLDKWERDLETIFTGHPLENPDIALIDTLEQFPIDIQPFRDMIAGQRMDLYRSRYETFEDLNLYCYRVAGTVGLMSNAVMGVEHATNMFPWGTKALPDMPEKEAVALGIANQLTNILRDVGEDARRGRIYLPLEDLELFNYTETDLMNGVIDERWKNLMKFQIQRARIFYNRAESGIRSLSKDARWPVWAALMLYRQILNEIERNQYDVFTKRAYVSNARKVLTVGRARVKAEVI